MAGALGVTFAFCTTPHRSSQLYPFAPVSLSCLRLLIGRNVLGYYGRACRGIGSGQLRSRFRVVVIQLVSPGAYLDRIIPPQPCQTMRHRNQDHQGYRNNANSQSNYCLRRPFWRLRRRMILLTQRTSTIRLTKHLLWVVSAPYARRLPSMLKVVAGQFDLCIVAH